MTKKCKKLIALVFIISIIIDPRVVYSADVIYSVCKSCGGQEALLVGKVVGTTSEKGIMTVEIVRLVSGMLKYKNNKVNIQFDKLEKIDVGDEVLLSLESVNPNEALYKIAYKRACYFVQCMDDKKIKNFNTLFDYNSFDSFDIILQWYCNTGELLAEKDLSNTIRYYRWVGEKKELVFDQSKGIWYEDSLSSKFNAPDVIRERNERYWSRVILIVVCLSFGLFVYLFIRTRYKRKKIQEKR